ncbi:MAG TPA: hypothetical protein VGP61_08020 [Gemmatimonadales bacterium]|jgi:hypothetical protein|nr:hypothetical protein [Gemmatimonadales bacterium]
MMNRLMMPLFLLIAGVGLGILVGTHHLVDPLLPASSITDPTDRDIQTLKRLQNKLATAIAPLDSIAVDSLLAPDMRAINARGQATALP